MLTPKSAQDEIRDLRDSGDGAVDGLSPNVTVEQRQFDFDYVHNVIFYKGLTIRLTPHESDILRVLLNNRARPTPMSVLVQRVYGINEPDSATTSIRVAIHSLRKKIMPTGMTIKTEHKLGYEIEASHIPELNRRLTDRILLVLNHARSSGEREVAAHLEAALTVAEQRRSIRIANRT